MFSMLDCQIFRLLREVQVYGQSKVAKSGIDSSFIIICFTNALGLLSPEDQF